MNVHLIGHVDVDTLAIAATAWKANERAVNTMVDRCPVELHSSAHFLTQIGVLASCDSNTLAFLRNCDRELDFLFYIFIGETNDELERFLQHANLYWLPVRNGHDWVIAAGTLKQWVTACQEGTNQSDAGVVEWFCRVRVILSEKAGMSHVFSRFHDEPILIDNKKLFRLRYQ